jgi:hypothetical protein
VPEYNVGNVAILLGNSDGTFESAVITYVVTTLESAAAGDFNGDGKADVAIVDGADGYLIVLIGKGDGTFEAPARYPTGGSAGQVSAADLNGDGYLDLAVANFDSSVAVLLGSKTGSPKWRVGADPDAGARGRGGCLSSRA